MSFLEAFKQQQLSFSFQLQELQERQRIALEAMVEEFSSKAVSCQLCATSALTIADLKQQLSDCTSASEATIKSLKEELATCHASNSLQARQSCEILEQVTSHVFACKTDKS